MTPATMARAILVGLLCSVGACAYHVAAQRPDDCAAADRCTIQGTLYVDDFNGVPMGVLDVGGECVMVSLPEQELQRLSGRDWPGYSVSGEVFQLSPPDGAVETYINDRQVGWGNCGGLVIFVD